MRMMKNVLKRLFVLAFIIGIAAIIVWSVLNDDDVNAESNDSYNVLLEETNNESDTVEQNTLSGVIIPDEPRPDWVGYSYLKFVLGNEANARSVKLYISGGEAYVFLPSYADLSSVYLNYGDEIESISIDGKYIADGEIINSVELEYPYYLSEVINGTTYSYYLVFMKSANLPSVFIDTANGTTEYIKQSKDNWEPGNIVCFTQEGKMDTECEIEKIHCRGHSSFSGVGTEQKSYSFRVKESCDILGMGKGKKWRLISNCYDTTRLRNALAYTFAKDLGIPYAIDYKYTDVYFNGEYAGNYIICEAIEVAENRVEIGKGDYLLSQNPNDLDEDAVYFRQDNYRVWEVLNTGYVDTDELYTVRDSLNEIRYLLSRCEDDRVYDLLCKKVDEESFAKLYIVNTFINETDSNQNSMFYYYTESDGKLYAGPVWDFDHGFGAVYEFGGKIYNINTYMDGIPELMSKNERFIELVRKLLQEHIGAVYSLETNIESYASLIRASVRMSNMIYDLVPASAGYLDFGDYEQNEQYLSEMVINRNRLMFDVINNYDLYHKIRFQIDGSIWEDNYYHKTYWIKDGEIIPQEHIEYFLQAYGWSDLKYANGAMFMEDRPITSDLVIKGVAKEE